MVVVVVVFCGGGLLWYWPRFDSLIELIGGVGVDVVMEDVVASD